MSERPFPWPLEYVAERLHYSGKDRIRSVRRLFAKHGVPYLRRDAHTQLVTEAQWRLLLARMETCSSLGNEAASTTSVERCESGKRSKPSKSTVRDLIASKLPTSTEPDSNPKSDRSSFTVLRGGLPS